LKKSRLKVILTHDVDWPPAGPGAEHIMARRDRFDGRVIERVQKEGFNPYNNIALLMDLERGRGLRSTFFFRPRYDDGTPVSAYSDEVRALQSGGWEVGVHINDAGSFESVSRERDLVGAVCGAPPVGCRVHYLRLVPDSHQYIKRAGFAYDSSLVFSKNEVSPRNAGYLNSGGLIVFPITIMDAYVFTYMKVPEDKVPSMLESAIEACLDRGYMTVLWHDSSILMRGGRSYPKMLDVLASREDVECVTAFQAYRSVPEGGAL
jgi:hypothetical protein